MSPEWHAAAEKLLADQSMEADIVITTALIPGRQVRDLLVDSQGRGGLPRERDGDALAGVAEASHEDLRRRDSGHDGPEAAGELDGGLGRADVLSLQGDAPPADAL